MGDVPVSTSRLPVGAVGLHIHTVMPVLHGFLGFEPRLSCLYASAFKLRSVIPNLPSLSHWHSLSDSQGLEHRGQVGDSGAGGHADPVSHLALLHPNNPLSYPAPTSVLTTSPFLQPHWPLPPHSRHPSAQGPLHSKEPLGILHPSIPTQQLSFHLGFITHHLFREPFPHCPTFGCLPETGSQNSLLLAVQPGLASDARHSCSDS